MVGNSLPQLAAERMDRQDVDRVCMSVGTTDHTTIIFCVGGRGGHCCDGTALRAESSGWTPVERHTGH
jgi:hypothetical protein